MELEIFRYDLSQDPYTWPYPEPDECTPHALVLFIQESFNIIFPRKPVFPRRSLP
jgi:hypothetical protein